MYVEDDERSGLDGELLSALAALHAPRSSRYGEICEASRNREIEFANFYVAERSRSWGPVVSYASRFSTASDLIPFASFTFASDEARHKEIVDKLRADGRETSSDS